MNKYFKYILLLVTINFFLPLAVLAHAGCGCGASGGGPGLAGPIITLPAKTLHKKKFFVSLGGSYTNYNNFPNTQLASLSKAGNHVHNINNIFTPNLSLGYGITDDLSVLLAVPYVFKYDIRTGHDGIPLQLGNSIGIGDITLSGQYRFFKNLKHNIHAALLAGIKIPSGATRVKGDDGVLFGADEQPGSGSFDPLVGLSLTKDFMLFSVSASGSYKFATQGTQSSNLGDIANINAAISHRIINQHLKKIFKEEILGKHFDWDVIMEANALWREKPILREEGLLARDNNHGGFLLYLTPGFRITYDKKWIANLGVSLPAAQSLYGIQQAPNATLVFGITRTFN